MSDFKNGGNDMKKIEFVKDGILTTYRIEEAFMEEGFRILVDYENRKESVTWIDKDGESDRVFEKREDAEMVVLEYVNKLLKIGAIEKFVVS